MAAVRLIILGRQGSGKGTQGAILGRIPGFFHLSCGEVFRSLDIHSELGSIFYEYSSKGELVPDEITVRMWAENMHAQTILSLYKPHDDLLLLDGIPRNVDQARLMEKYIDVLGIVHLVCPDKEAMIKRLRRRALKENRIDDAQEEVIRRRWDIYERETAPVLGYYPKNKIIEVNAVGSPASVLQHVLQVVVPIQDTLFHNPISGENE